jgi:hypothetical protein
VLFELKFLFCKKKRCQINRRIRIHHHFGWIADATWHHQAPIIELLPVYLFFLFFSWKQKTLYYSRILFHNFRSFATKRQTHSAQPEVFFPNKISSKHNPQLLKPDKIDYNYPLTTKKILRK